MGRDVFGIVGTIQGGSFHVESVVAEGGFGVVYRAHHGAFRAPIALKCLKVPDTMTSEHRDAFLEQFREEGELLFRLSSSIPAVVRPLHVDTLQTPDGRVVPFLALEWLEGEALSRVIRRRHKEGKAPIPIRKLVTLLSPVASALARAHRFRGARGEVSIIHSDLKPENIFIVEGDASTPVKVLDFGIARTKSAATQRAGRITSGEAFGAFTPAYAAPEQWLPKRFGTAGPWTDVWGLALTMVEVLAGHAVIEGDVAAMMGTATDPTRRPTPRSEGIEVSEAVEAAFEKALAVHPKDRTPRIETFWSELETALDLPHSITAETLQTQLRPLLSSMPPPPAHPSASTLPAVPALPGGLSPAASTLLSAQPKQGARPAGKPAKQAAAGSSVAIVTAPPAPAKPRAPAKPSSPTRLSGAGGEPGTLTIDVDVHSLQEPPKFELSIAPGLRRRRRLEPLSIEPRLDLRARLRVPLKLVVAAALLVTADRAYAHVAGSTWHLGSLSMMWIAGPLALAGVGLACWKIFVSQ